MHPDLSLLVETAQAEGANFSSAAHLLVEGLTAGVSIPIR